MERSYKKITFPHNDTKNKTTGYSPNFLLFGRDSRLPINQIIETTSNIHNLKTYDEFLKNWQGSMNSAYKIVKQINTTSNKIGKRHYDKKVYGTEISEGDRV